MPDISIVVPVYNEEENLPLLHRAVVEALAGFPRSFELLLVDDGSRDSSFLVASAIAARDPRVRVVKFRRNYGQTAAMAAGIREARGDIILTMDGDLQNDPVDIPRLVALIDAGHDIAVGWRRKRQDGRLRVFVSRVANQIMARLMGVAVRDSGCSLKAFSAPLVKSLPMYGEMHRFIPALSRLAGARLAQIEVEHHSRRFGVSKYGFSRIYKVMLDIISIRLLISYVRRPVAWVRFGVVFALLVAAAMIGGGVSAGGLSPVLLCVGVIWMSLALSLVGWAILGQLLASLTPNVSSYAALGAGLSARITDIRRIEADGLRR